VRDYTHVIEKDTVIQGRTCWKIVLTPKPDAPVVWGKLEAYVDQTDYIQVLLKQYDEDGYLVNKMVGSDIKEMDGVVMATRMELIPLDKEGNKTIMVIEKIKFNEGYDDNFFTVQNMKRIR